jgi:glycosyltransferase involved in cell wall biosynthesis
MNPLVSIIIPVFNQDEMHLHDCINSALGQSYNNIEIIISDNHSTNGSSSVIAGYESKKIVKVRPLVFLDMKGNFAFAASCASTTSKYLSFLSSDDLLAPSAIAELVELAENNPSLAFAAGNIIQSIKPPIDFCQLENRIRTSESVLGLHTFQQCIGLFCPWQSGSTWMAGELIRHAAYNLTGGFAACDYYFLGDLWLTKELVKQKNGGFGLVGSTTAFFRQRDVGVLPADGERGIGIYLDMLRYNNEMLEIVTNRVINHKQRIKMHWASFLVLVKISALMLIARKFHGPLSGIHEEYFRRYIRSTDKRFEKYLLEWVMSVNGLWLDFAAIVARSTVDCVRKALLRVRSGATRSR